VFNLVGYTCASVPEIYLKKEDINVDSVKKMLLQVVQVVLRLAQEVRRM